MVNECGITLYFRNDRIHIRKRTVEVLNHPAYVQLFINEGKKQLFIQSSTKNKDAFRVYYKPESKKKASKETGNTLPTDNQAGKRADFAIRLRRGSLLYSIFLFCATYGKNRAEAAGDAHKNNVAKCSL